MKTPSRTQYKTGLDESRKYNTLCICEICTCGRHRCPKNSHTPFQGETTYHADYKPCSGIVNELRRPTTAHYHERHYDPKLLKTTYDAEFIPHKIDQSNNPAQNFEYKPKSGKFYGETEYNKSYINKEIQHERPREIGSRYVPNKTKFEGSTTYNAEFSPKKAENAFVPPNINYERRKVPFEGKTTYNTEFHPHQIPPNTITNADRNSRYVPRKGRFEGESDYKANYKPYEIERDNHCPILDLPQYPRECSPGKTHVNYSAEKNKWY